MSNINENKTVVCENCGAEIDAHEAKCPFCGYINQAGAEEKYMQDMQEIKENLAQVDEEIKDIVKKETKKVGLIVLVTVLAIAVLLVIVLVIAVVSVRTIRRDMGYSNLAIYEEEPLAAAKWNDEHLADMNAMYDAGDIEGLVEYYGKLEADGNIGAFNSWSHSFLITQIYNLRFWTKYLDDKDLDDLTIHQVMFNLLYNYNGDYKGTNMPENDYEYMMAEVDVHMKKACDRFGITIQDLEQMNAQCVGGSGYVDPAKVADYCDANKDKFK